jgi:hypothetical protein
MGKKKVDKQNVQGLPFVSICTPTFNRRPFIETMFACFRNQTYPSACMEWIIVDDGNDKIVDLIRAANIPQIRYFPLETKMALGEKRNYMHQQARGDILVYMDDDDYYPPERVSHAVEMLIRNPTKLCAGASELFIYYKHDIHKMYKCGPYGENHATAGTFAFRRELLDHTRYDDHAALAEEKKFLNNFTIPMVQLDPHKTILVFSHEHNTFDKRIMLNTLHPLYFRESVVQVRDFIRKEQEAPIYRFFMEQIDSALKNYDPGLPKWKPDVLTQIEEIEKEKEQLLAQTTVPKIMVERPGQSPRQMEPREIVDTIRNQQEQIKSQTARIAELENMVVQLQQQFMKMRQNVGETRTQMSFQNR